MVREGHHTLRGLLGGQHPTQEEGRAAPADGHAARKAGGGEEGEETLVGDEADEETDDRDGNQHGTERRKPPTSYLAVANHREKGDDGDSAKDDAEFEQVDGEAHSEALRVRQAACDGRVSIAPPARLPLPI